MTKTDITAKSKIGLPSLSSLPSFAKVSKLLMADTNPELSCEAKVLFEILISRANKFGYGKDIFDDNMIYRVNKKCLRESDCGIAPPKRAMWNPNINNIAKGILLYCCAFAGNTGKPNIALLSVADILRHLQISEDIYNKHIRKLKENGYIRVKPNKYEDKSDLNEYEVLL